MFPALLPNLSARELIAHLKARKAPVQPLDPVKAAKFEAAQRPHVATFRGPFLNVVDGATRGELRAFAFAVLVHGSEPVAAATRYLPNPEEES